MNAEKNKAAIADINERLVTMEKEMFASIGSLLVAEKPGRDPAKCDKIFGLYTHAYLRPCISNGLSSRAAIAGRALADAVIDVEKRQGVEYHKGALFHDVGIANFISGNVDEYEYFLAMADEENFKLNGAGYKRGTLNLQVDDLTKQTMTERMQGACALLNGTAAAYAADFSFLTGSAVVTAERLDAWRQTLEPLEQFEFLRMIHEAYQFLGSSMPDYGSVKDHPFVLFRLAKTIGHFSQWVESILTRWQAGAFRTLSPKLGQDPDFGTALNTAAGGPNTFPGPNVHGAAIDTELNKLATDLLAQPSGSQRHWRALRVLYIVRNATAHTIDQSLAMYTNRTSSLKLLQLVFASVFVISHLKHKPVP